MSASGRPGGLGQAIPVLRHPRAALTSGRSSRTRLPFLLLQTAPHNPLSPVLGASPLLPQDPACRDHQSVAPRIPAAPPTALWAWEAEPRRPVTERDHAGRWQQGGQRLGVWPPSLCGGGRGSSPPHCSRSLITGDCQPRVTLDGVMKTRQWHATPRGSLCHRWC